MVISELIVACVAGVPPPLPPLFAADTQAKLIKAFVTDIAQDKCFVTYLTSCHLYICH